jgi:hypothetical protein
MRDTGATRRSDSVSEAGNSIGGVALQSENNWAPPAIGDIRVPDRDLGRRLSRQPSVEMRAKMLGMDWTTLKAARARLLLGAWAISVTVAVLAVAAGLGSSDHGSGHAHIATWLGIAFVVVAAFASMIEVRSVSRLPVQIARNDPATADSYRALAKLSPSRSLLGYRVRWILVRHAATTAFAVALVALVVRYR